MSTDPTTPIVPVTAPETTEPGTTSSPLNVGQLASLTKTEEICRIALMEHHLMPLISHDPGEEPVGDVVTEEGIRAVITLCDQARGKGTAAVEATGGKVQTTIQEQQAKKDLLVLIHFCQARARQKHFFANPAILTEYGIGHNIYNSRALLEGWAQTCYDKTATDRLPKVTEAKRAELLAALTRYKATQTEQTGATSGASGHRIDRNDLVNQATARRMWLQFAADAEWPHTDPANYPIRREFQLPANRPFIG